MGVVSGVLVSDTNFFFLRVRVRFSMHAFLAPRVLIRYGAIPYVGLGHFYERLSFF